ncbi:MAG: SRPBCC family protein [Fimbriimonadales bacterium]|nr:SRPBCC family protein [Fimbriimonadales bacterium]
MPRVELELVIHAPRETVYAVAREVEAFPEFMPDVKSVKVLEKSEDGSRTVTEWVAYASQLKLQVKWTEEDLWNDANYTCHFRQLKGDYDQMQGLWEFLPHPEGTLFRSTLDYELRLPLLGALVQKVVHHLVTLNLKGIMEGIKARAEAKARGN